MDVCVSLKDFNGLRIGTTSRGMDSTAVTLWRKLEGVGGGPQLRGYISKISISSLYQVTPENIPRRNPCCMSRWTSEEFLGVFESVGDWSGMCIQTHSPTYLDLIEPAKYPKQKKTWRGCHADVPAKVPM